MNKTIQNVQQETFNTVVLSHGFKSPFPPLPHPPKKKSMWWLLEVVEFYDLKREGFLANRSLTFCLMSFVVILRSDEIIWYSAVTKIQGPIPT